MPETAVFQKPALREALLPKHRRSMPKASIGFYLVVMVCAIALPLLGFVGLLLAQLQNNERTALESRTEREAQSLAAGVTRALQEMSTTLQLLATSPELESGDLESFHNRAQAALRSGSLFAILVRDDGQQLLNTRVPYGTPLGKTSNLPALEAVLQSGRIEVSDVFLEATSGRWVFNVTLPLPDAVASEGAALIITKNADELARLAPTEGLPAGWTTALIDNSGRLVTSGSGQMSVRQEPFGVNLLAEMKGTSGVIYGLSDAPDIVGYARLWGWSWTAVVWGPVAAAQASILTTWRLLIFGGLALLATAVVAAILLARQLRSSVREIADMADQVGHGEIVAPVNTPILEVDMVSRALSIASFDRHQSENRIHLMLGELAHRTKNLLAVTQAMIHQTSRQADTVEAFQTAIGERIAGLGRSIDLLTGKEWSGVPMQELVEKHLSNFLGSADQLEITGENFLLKPDAVQNLGLVLHELSTNAVKYGALSVPGGRIIIEWQVSDADAAQPELTLSWLEAGGPAASKPQHKGFGSQVVERHAASAFRGKVTVDYGAKGLFWTIKAPLHAFASDPGPAAEAG